MGVSMPIWQVAPDEQTTGEAQLQASGRRAIPLTDCTLADGAVKIGVLVAGQVVLQDSLQGLNLTTDRVDSHL